MNHIPYALITPARNEEKHITALIESVIHQTVLPVKWVIVNDGSTDATASIVQKYLPEHPWIELLDLPVHRDRSFAAKAYAVNAGVERLAGISWEVVGNIDSDVTFDPDYCEFLIDKFEGDPRLGVAGTIFQEDGGYSSGKDSFEGQNHVAGGCQLFRRECFQEIGGYVPNKAGGVDWIAVTTARMKGWRTRSYREKSFYHYRKLGTAERSLLASAFSYGEKDYYLGNHPLWEMVRVLYRITKNPLLLGGLSLGCGYFTAWVRQMKRPVSDELMRFHRKEEMLKLRAIAASLFRLQKVDNFEVKPS